MIRLYGYESFPQERTFDTYNDVDCYNYSDVHDYIKFLKWGYGKVTDHACREIRLKRLTREEGIDLVKKYQNKKPKNLKLFLDWIGITENGFNYFINQYRDSNIWKKDNNFKWKLRDSIINHHNDSEVDNVRLPKIENCEFIVTPLKKPLSKEKKYILIGRGHVDEWRAP